MVDLTLGSINIPSFCMNEYGNAFLRVRKDSTVVQEHRTDLANVCFCVVSLSKSLT